MVGYTKKGPFQNNVATPPLNAAFFDGIETALTASAGGYVTGLVGDGVADDTAALQAAINTTASAVVSTSLGTPNVLSIPAGKYKITATLVVPPYVKLRSAGTVVFLWNGTSGPMVWYAPLASDPATLYSPLQKQQWQDAPLLNGANGGFVFINQGPATAVALELGSRTDLSGAPLSRYVCTDVAIQSFGTAMQWNAYNHYIGRFVNFHIENNTTAISIGASGANTNSGENFTIVRSVIAGATTAIAVNTFGFDVTYDNCSIDFISSTVLAIRYGYGRHYFLAGHIENINATNSAGGGIVNSTSSTEVQVRIDGTTILSNAVTQFKGSNVILTGSAYHLHYDSETQVTSYLGPVLADDAVDVTDFRQLQRMWRRLVSRNTNLISDPHWAAETTGTKASLIDWNVSSSSGVTYSIVTDSPDTGRNSLHVTLPASGYITLTYKNSVTVLDKLAQFSHCGYYTDTVGANIAADIEMHDWAGTARGNTGQVTFANVTTAPANTWLMPSYVLAPQSSALFAQYPYARPIFVFSNPTGSTINVRVPFLYFGR